MTEEKTCYNCGNKNCHIFYSTVKQDVEEHHETFEYRNFDCVNHDKWEELKVEEIRTDNTETLKNALERIKELENENELLKNRTKDFENQILGLLIKYEDVYERFPDLKEARDKAEFILKENEELKERHAEIIEAFASASSGDDFEMAESAREIMEILNIPCYRHGKVVSKLTKAKNHIHRLLVLLTEGKRSYAVIDEARAFLQEESE